MRPQDIENALRDIENQGEIRRSIKDGMMNFPDHDNVQLFGRWSQPDHFTDNADSVTRENATSNLPERDYKRVILMESIRSNFIRMFSDLIFIDKKSTESPDKNIMTVIHFIGDDTTIIKATSKGLNGWFGGLVITSKRIADVITNPVQKAGSMFGLRK